MDKDSIQKQQPIIRRRGVVAVVKRGEQFLSICRSAAVVAPGKICFPGGGIEGDESEPIALVREMQEELGVEFRPRECVWRNVTSWGTSLAWWLGEIDAEAIFVPNPLEVESVHWFSSDELLAHVHLLDSNREFLAALAAGKIETHGSDR
jgi:8-oxo-dGTP pyrophosphatase MutT (NUDIX family)